jgi:hypothetical protein
VRIGFIGTVGTFLTFLFISLKRERARTNPRESDGLA